MIGFIKHLICKLRGHRWVDKMDKVKIVEHYSRGKGTTIHQICQRCHTQSFLHFPPWVPYVTISAHYNYGAPTEGQNNRITLPEEKDEHGK